MYLHVVFVPVDRDGRVQDAGPLKTLRDEFGDLAMLQASPHRDYYPRFRHHRDGLQCSQRYMSHWSDVACDPGDACNGYGKKRLQVGPVAVSPVGQEYRFAFAGADHRDVTRWRGAGSGAG